MFVVQCPGTLWGSAVAAGQALLGVPVGTPVLPGALLPEPLALL